jgi:hypothetical protein
MLLNGVSHLDIYENICRNSIRQKTLGFCFPTPPIAYGSTKITDLKDAVQSVCKQRLCLHFGIQNIEFYSKTIYIFMILEYNILSRDNNQALQEHKMK